MSTSLPRERRNRTVLLTCVRCGTEFHPFTGFEETAQYCSRACNMAYRRDKLAAMRAEGRDPAHGGAAAEKRRIANRRRRASGELMGAQLRKARLDALQATLPPPVAAPSSLTPEQQVERDSLAYLAAGNRYEGLATRLLARTIARDDGRTIILAGYGAGLRVEHDALVVTEGRTHHPQTPLVHTLWRGVHEVSRIVCLDPKGSVSFPAVHWCAEQGITLFLVDRLGYLLSLLTPSNRADAGLRRRQYFAEVTGQDVPICQELLRRKLTAQRETLTSHPDLPGRIRALDVLGTAVAWLRLDELPPWLMSVDLVRTYEARTAAAYFNSWVGWPLHWGKADIKRVPPHWLAAQDRTSPVSSGGNARHAVDPLNAVLNYAYAILEGQSRQALTGLGFDVTCGFLHADKGGRDSLVYDLMECERGTVDGLVLDFLSRTTLRYGDVIAVSDGSCRLHPQLARCVVAACRVDQRRLDNHALWLRDTLNQPRKTFSVQEVERN
ncbi:MAG: CRISPR-associated endonuclease Cas1 [Ktedonobacterales bacterium]